ncbi:MAG: heavy metal-binding domain-containing protein [Candidatus Krumholzibacteriia bacterium]
MRASLSAFRVLLFGLALAASGWTPAWGQHEEHSEEAGHSHQSAEKHGGTVTMTKEFHFEVAFERDMVHVHGYDGAQKPVDLKGVTGRVVIHFRDSKRKPIEAALKYVGPGGEGSHGHEHPGSMEPGHLMAAVDLSRVPDGDAKATFKLGNLPGKSEKEVQFKETFQLARQVVYACPMNDSDPTGEPGSCPKCGMTLERSRYIYSCPEHPAVTSRDAGELCWIDNKKLEKRPDAAEEQLEDDSHDSHGHSHGSH